MYCREVSNIVLARSCSIYRCKELEKVFTFVQVCVGAPLAADHAHNRERVPLSVVFRPQCKGCTRSRHVRGLGFDSRVRTLFSIDLCCIYLVFTMLFIFVKRMYS